MPTDIPAISNVTYSNGDTSTITYEWAITSVKTKNEGAFNNAIIQTFWTLTGTDSQGRSATFVGATPFSTAGKSVDYGFIEFSQLQESDVLGWIQSEVTGSYASHITGYIFDKLDGQISETLEPPLPWAQNNSQ
jgi:hypothetical protein